MLQFICAIALIAALAFRLLPPSLLAASRARQHVPVTNKSSQRWRLRTSAIASGWNVEVDGQCPPHRPRVTLSAPKLAPASARKWYLCMVIESEQLQNARPDWFSYVFIQADNAPDLMKNGLYWSEANVVPEGGYITTKPQDIREECKIAGSTSLRSWKLKSAKESSSGWEGSIEAYAADCRILRDLGIGQMRRDRAIYMHVISPGGSTVYLYPPEEFGMPFNVIYDDMPMEGWWPWPRSTEESLV